MRARLAHGLEMHAALALLLLASPTKFESPFEADSQWETVTEGHQFAEGMAFDGAGHLLFTDVPRSQLFRIDKETGKKSLLDEHTGRTNGIAVGPDRKLYGCAGGDRKIYAWDMQTWKKETIAEGPHSNDIAVREDGTIFFTDPQTNTVWRVSAKERKLEKAAALEWNPNGIALSEDESKLYVAEFSSKNIHIFPIDKDNNLGESQESYRLETPEDGKGHLDGMVAYRGMLFAGTAKGLQIVESQGKRLTIPIPHDLPRCNYVRISPDGKWLYAAHAKVVLRRKLNQNFLKFGFSP